MFIVHAYAFLHLLESQLLCFASPTHLSLLPMSKYHAIYTQRSNSPSMWMMVVCGQKYTRPLAIQPNAYMNSSTSKLTWKCEWPQSFDLKFVFSCEILCLGNGNDSIQFVRMQMYSKLTAININGKYPLGHTFGCMLNTLYFVTTFDRKPTQAGHMCVWIGRLCSSSSSTFTPTYELLSVGLMPRNRW